MCVLCRLAVEHDRGVCAYIPTTTTFLSNPTLSHTTITTITAGWYNNVNNTRWSYQVVNAAMPGYEGRSVRL